MATHESIISTEINSLREQLSTISPHKCYASNFVDKEDFDIDIEYNQLTGFLTRKGFTVTRNNSTSSAFVASWGGGQGAMKPVHVGFMCEYNPESRGSGSCGHNLIAKAALAAASCVKAVLSHQQEKLAGRISVLGFVQVDGDCRMGTVKVDPILPSSLADVDFALMVHPSRCNIVQPKYLLCRTIWARFTGLISRVEIEALVTGSYLYKTKNQSDPFSRISFPTEGQAPNIVKYAQIVLREKTDERFEGLSRLAVESCNEGAQMAGCHVDGPIEQLTFPDIVHNSRLAQVYTKLASTVAAAASEEVVGEEACLSQSAQEERAGSSDLGAVSCAVPTLQPAYSIGGSSMDHTAYCKAVDSKFALEATLRQAKIMALTSLEVMMQPAVLREIVDEFSAQKSA